MGVSCKPCGKMKSFFETIHVVEGTEKKDKKKRPTQAKKEEVPVKGKKK